MTISDCDIAALKALQVSFMTATGTVARTGASALCRLSVDSREIRIGDINPRFMPLQRYSLTFPDGFNVQSGDRISVVDNATGASLGTYFCLILASPQSFSTSTLIHCVRYGSTGLPYANYDGSTAALTVTAKQQKTDATMTLPCYLRALHPDDMAMLRGQGLDADFKITWDYSLTFSGGQPVRELDTISWKNDAAMSSPLTGQIQRVTRDIEPFNTADAYVKTTARRGS